MVGLLQRRISLGFPCLFAQLPTAVVRTVELSQWLLTGARRLGVSMNTQVFRVRDDGEEHGELARQVFHDLLIEVDFKWLMAGQGWWVDSDRMKNDPIYASACIQSALNSDCFPLRDCAQCLRHELDATSAAHAIRA